ncbi:uncharacterized protein LOC124138006 isoform X2 [Haliotis rufescens]|nr:uncharacterized protein LOC124138006 isoform X2 [Haliotis rufescens]
MDTQKYRDASLKAVNCLISQMDENALYQQEELKGEFSALYKLPTQLLLWGKQEIANKIFDHVKKNVLQPNGDFYSYPKKKGWERKCCNPLLAYNWPYINGWIAVAAQRGGRFDISVPAFNYIRTFYDPVQKGFLWNQPYNPDVDTLEQSLCAFMCGHLGYTALFCGDMEVACSTGDTLIRFMDIQPNLDEEFLMKMDSSGQLIRSGWPEDKTVFFRIKRKESPNLFYQLGFPAILLAKLYLATGTKRYLEGARSYLDFAYSCGESLYTFIKSHKVAYGASLVAAITKEKKYATMATRISDFIMSTRTESGMFLSTSPILERFDQTAENIGWMREISVELESYQRS